MRQRGGATPAVSGDRLAHQLPYLRQRVDGIAICSQLMRCTQLVVGAGRGHGFFFFAFMKLLKPWHVLPVRLIGPWAI
jgi:hypothetical protein